MEHNSACPSSSLRLCEHALQAGDCRVHLDDWRFGIGWAHRRVQTVNAEWAEPDRFGGAVSIQCVPRGAVNLRFRNEDRVSPDLVSLHPVFEFGPIDIGRVEIDSGRHGAIYLEIVRMRPSAWILSGLFHEVRELRVHIHGQRVFSLSSLGDRLDPGGVSPGHEDLVGGLSEYLTPRSALRVEVNCQFRRKLNPPGKQSANEFLRDGSIKLPVSFPRAVSSGAEISHFVLDLYHQHRLPLPILLTQMCHSRCKGAGFKAERLRSESRQDLERRAIHRLRPWKAPGVGLYPGRRVFRERVLPTSEPQQHQMKILLASDVDPVIQNPEIDNPSSASTRS